MTCSWTSSALLSWSDVKKASSCDRRCAQQAKLSPSPLVRLYLTQLVATESGSQAYVYSRSSIGGEQWLMGFTGGCLRGAFTLSHIAMLRVAMLARPPSIASGATDPPPAVASNNHWTVGHAENTMPVQSTRSRRRDIMSGAASANERGEYLRSTSSSEFLRSTSSKTLMIAKISYHECIKVLRQREYTSRPGVCLQTERLQTKIDLGRS